MSLTSISEILGWPYFAA